MQIRKHVRIHLGWWSAARTSTTTPVLLDHHQVTHAHVDVVLYVPAGQVITITITTLQINLLFITPTPHLTSPIHHNLLDQLTTHFTH
jgi:hypothetical protein